jgi:hypothetical protein
MRQERDGDSNNQESPAKHILPSSGTLIGVCVTLIGLVKILETRIGGSRVDEYAALTSVVFLASAIFSYISIRHPERPEPSERCESIADQCFLIGLIGIAAIAVLFAYEII